MKGLLIKDYYTLLRQMKLFLVILVFFTMMPGFSGAAFAVVYSALLPVTALAYDERSGWDKLAAMMPYKSSQIVLSKYLLGYTCMVGAMVLSTVMQYIYSIIRHTAFSGDIIAEIVGSACAASLLLAFNLPIMFKMGVEKGRMIFFMITAVIVVAVMALADKLEGFLDTASAATPQLMIILLMVAILNVLSIMISTRIYDKKY